MSKIRKLVSGFVVVLLALVLVPVTANAAPTYTLFGEASEVNPGKDSDTAVQLVSDADPGFGSVEFEFTTGLTFAELTQLSTDFNVTNDNCGGGAPRFSVTLDQGGTEKNVFVYLGPAPNYNTCTPDTWVNSGDLLESGLTVDTSQLGGTFYDAYDNALTNYGALTITQISLVTDAGGSQGDGEQTVLVDNVTINTDVFTFEAETVTVTIQKYVDGAVATPLSADNAAFPMASSWDAENLGGVGSGTYTLDPDGFTSTDAYEAVTSDMSLGSDYATNEVLTTSVVGADCAPGTAFALVGYSTGDTLEEAQTATLSTTAPSFTDLQGDKFVIVWNETCAEPPTSKDQCKKGGWETYGYFKNQGDCVSFVATKGRNQPAGSTVLSTF